MKDSNAVPKIHAMSTKQMSGFVLGRALAGGCY